MEFWTFQTSNLRFHLRHHPETGGSMMRTPPVVRFHFNFGPSRHCCVVQHFWCPLLDPRGWQQQVQLALINVLDSGDGGSSYDVFFLAALLCRRLEAYLRLLRSLYGRAMAVNAFVDILRLPTPPLAAGGSMWIPEQGSYYHAGGVPLAPTPEYLEAEFVDDVLMRSLVGEGSGIQTPVPSAPPPYMEKVKVVTFETEAGETEVYAAAGESCSICLEDFKVAQQLGVLPCRHCFHVGCLEKWLARGRVCPVCRFDLCSGSSQDR